MNGEYPVRFAVDCPDRELDRLTTAFRIFTVIPIAIVLATLGGYSARWGVYLTLINDRYPSTDEQQSVHLDIPYPDARAELNRWLPIVKWLLAIPHYIVLVFLDIGAVFAAIGAWFTILFTGRHPRSIFDDIEAVIRWHNRVVGYALVLVTDEYPPFRLAP